MAKVKKPEDEAQEPVQEPEKPKGRWYVCSCGHKEQNALKFGGHVSHGNRLEPGKHESTGLWDLDTGEQIRPPTKQRTPEQKAEVEKESREKGKAARKAVKKDVKNPGLQFTQNPANAQYLQLVPKVYTMEYSPVLRACYVCAIEKWGWPADMTLQDFIDTWFFYSFDACGAHLNTVTLDETPEEEAEREAMLEEFRRRRSVPPKAVEEETTQEEEPVAAGVEE